MASKKIDFSDSKQIKRLANSNHENPLILEQLGIEPLPIIDVEDDPELARAEYTELKRDLEKNMSKTEAEKGKLFEQLKKYQKNSHSDPYTTFRAEFMKCMVAQAVYATQLEAVMAILTKLKVH